MISIRKQYWNKVKKCILGGHVEHGVKMMMAIFSNNVKSAKQLYLKEIHYIKPNFKGFVKHVREWDKHNVCYSRKDMIELAKKYNTPLPKNFRKGELIYGRTK
jgi:hypothetical protein